MKLLIIIDDLRLGGTENVLASRLSELPSDIKVNIVCLFALGPVAEIIKDMGFDIDFLDMKKFGILKAFTNIRKIIEKNKIDIALCMRDVSRALFPKFLVKHVPVVVMMWDSPVIKRSFKQSWAEWFQVKFTESVHYCSSKNTAEALNREYGLEDVKVIPNCYDHNRFRIKDKFNKEDGPFNIISVGGFRKEKNYQHELEIAKRLKEIGFNFKYSIIGEDPYGIIQRDIVENRLEDMVISLGNRNDIPELLEKADLFLFTSYSEGFPVALIEAMAKGLPCVSYEFPSLGEIDKDFSSLVPIPQGDIDKAVEKIVYLGKNRDEGEKLGRRAAKHVSANFTSEINAEIWINFLRSLIINK